jgi:hypothetical protein
MTTFTLNTLLKALFMVSVLALTACASNQGRQLEIGFTPGSCTFNSNTEAAPDWYCAPDRLFDSAFLFETGNASSKILDMDFQRTVAMQNARLALARKAVGEVAETYASSALVDFSTDEERQSFIKQVTAKVETNITLPPVEREAMTFDSEGNLYLLVRTSKREMLEKLKAKESELKRIFNAELTRMNKTPVESNAPIVSSYHSKPGDM